jgi:hypothetical protein
MASIDTRPETSELLLEIGAKLFPRRYHRFKDMRPYQEACEWADTLDWRNNPYDRFLLRREILHHLEDEAIHGGGYWNLYNFATREEIAAKVDLLLNELPRELENLGVFFYVFTTAKGDLAFEHGLADFSYSKLLMRSVRS